MNAQQRLQTRTLRRVRRVRGKLHGTAARPRLSLDRSNQHVYLQAIDDDARVTIAGLSDASLKTTGTKTERAVAAATKIAELLKTKKVTAVVFDRGGFRYHGRVKAVADALRQAGLTL